MSNRLPNAKSQSENSGCSDDRFETARHEDVVGIEHRDPLAPGRFHKFIQTLVSAPVTAGTGRQIAHASGVRGGHAGGNLMPTRR